MSGCKELSEKLNIPYDCCSTCHDDDWDWGYEMCHLDIEGVEYYVCCAMMFSAKEKLGELKQL